MAEYDQNAPVESTDRGLFGFGGKKEEEVKSENAFSSEFKEKVQVSETEPKHESLLEKLHRSDSSSSSSSDEEEYEAGGEIKKKKKLKEKVKGEDKKKEEDTSIPVEKCDEVPLPVHEVQPEEKKGFMEKIKDKLPGGHKKAEEVAPPPAVVAPPPAAVVADPATPTEEKKGFLDKIKEKLPGYHSKTEEEKEKKETDHN